MTTEQVTVYFSLGSNVGDRQQNLKQALELLSQRLRVGKVSSTYETDAVGNIDQPRFLNMVCEAYTGLAPQGLLALVKGIESKLGRVPGKSGNPRPMDIDILLYGRQVVKSPDLIIPHPRMLERAFVLVPLAEIAPDMVHPVVSRTIRDILENMKEKQGVFKFGS